MEAENSAEREELLEKLEEGMEIGGIVKNPTDYGAFVDLGGIDGLLHITTWHGDASSILLKWLKLVKI